jgi:hypothetical protein
VCALPERDKNEQSNKANFHCCLNVDHSNSTLISIFATASWSTCFFMARPAKKKAKKPLVHVSYSHGRSIIIFLTVVLMPKSCSAKLTQFLSVALFWIIGHDSQISCFENISCRDHSGFIFCLLCLHHQRATRVLVPCLFKGSESGKALGWSYSSSSGSTTLCRTKYFCMWWTRTRLFEKLFTALQFNDS